MRSMRKFLFALFLGVCLLTPTAALALEKVVLVHALPRLSPSFAIASSLPEYLGYWKDEGLEVEVNTTRGSSMAMQIVMGGKADVAYGNPTAAMVGVQKGTDVSFYYTSIRGDIFGIALPAKGGLNGLSDLKGKTIGVSSFASQGTLYARALMGTLGFQRGQDFDLIEVGVGGRAAAALQSGRVHALSLWDAAYASMESRGLKFTKIIKDPRAKNFIAGSLVVPSKFYKTRRKMLIGLARGLAKAQIFQEVNPEAAVRIHWKVYPQTAPRGGVTDAAVRREAKVVAVRAGIQSRNAVGTNKFGDLPKANMEGYQNYLIRIDRLKKKIDVSKYYTNEFTDEINNFDREAVIKQAKGFKKP
ncbi:MAG: ABC transporter substrate-binding protein [bacterium]|nr:ABC transporter substrate-binding protein [bacterium]